MTLSDWTALLLYSIPIIGPLYAAWSWQIWFKAASNPYSEKSCWLSILFPFDSGKIDFNTLRTNWRSKIGSTAYCSCLAIIWPLDVIWIIFLWTFMFVICLLWVFTTFFRCLCFGESPCYC